MNTLKLNKLSENRLNEKEMRVLTGGAIKYEYNIAISSGTGACCDALCSCMTALPPFPPINPVSGVGVGSATSAMDMRGIT